VHLLHPTSFYACYVVPSFVALWLSKRGNPLLGPWVFGRDNGPLCAVVGMSVIWASVDLDRHMRQAR
jgi:hypothetical protein